MENQDEKMLWQELLEPVDKFYPNHGFFIINQFGVLSGQLGILNDEEIVAIEAAIRNTRIAKKNQSLLSEMDRIIDFEHRMINDTPAISKPIKSKKESGFVYLIFDSLSKLYKIGHTTGCPEKRMKQLSTANRNMELAASYPGSYLNEKEVHAMFHSNRKSGEWFDLNESDIEAIKEYFYQKTN